MNNTTKKRRNRRAYLDAFRRDAAGKYIYTGDVYRWGTPRRPVLVRLWLYGIGTFAAELAAGCVPGTKIEALWWVLIPYAAGLIFAGVLLWHIYELTDGGDPVPEFVWQKTAGRLPWFSVATAVCAGVAGAAEFVQIWLPGFAGQRLAGGIAVLLAWAALALCILIRRQLSRIAWQKQDGEAKAAQ